MATKHATYLALVTLSLLAAAAPSFANIIWFDETGDGKSDVTTSKISSTSLSYASPISAASFSTADITKYDSTSSGKGYDSFSKLADAYADFMGTSVTTINFNNLATGAVLADQYELQYGVTFSNTIGKNNASWSGVRHESDAYIENLTGYDGSYMPNGDAVVAKFDNDDAATPFTVNFEKPVASVGAFVAMGIEGDVHSLQISIFDTNGKLLGDQTVQSWLWDSKTSGQNYESFFGVTSDDAVISRVEILNNAKQNYANSLTIDNVAFARQASAVPSIIPEPATAAFLVFGASGLILIHRRRYVS